MKAESTIKICGQDVRLLYCAGAETAYEEMTGRSIGTFLPTVKDGKVAEPPKAMTGDYIYLGIGAIIAAYSSEGEKAPVSVSEVLYEASPQEVVSLAEEVVKLRNRWYGVPEVVGKEGDDDDGSDEKNA